MAVRLYRQFFSLCLLGPRSAKAGNSLLVSRSVQALYFIYFSLSLSLSPSLSFSLSLSLSLSRFGAVL